MTVFYDLAVSPVTYDFSWALVAGEAIRVKHGLPSVDVIIVPGPERGLRREDEDYEAVVDHAARTWRLDNIIVAMTRLLPSCGSVQRCATRGQATIAWALSRGAIYPSSYFPLFATAHQPSDLMESARQGAHVPLPLRATEQGRRYVDRWLKRHVGGRKLVTITLRQYDYGAERNSNLDAWRKFAQSLDRSRFAPVFVIDTEVALESALGSEFDSAFTEIPWNLGLRMALYERAYVNLMVNTGPHLLCMFNERCCYVMFKILTPSVRQTTEEYMRFLGFEIGGQPPFATEFQKWVWQDDRFDVISWEFEAMCRKIEALDG